MPSISSPLLLKLTATFRAEAFRVTGENPRVVVFPAIHSEVGDVVIHDDGDEVTVDCGRFTHSHFANFDEGIDNAERASRIAEGVVEFLQALFADEIEMYGSHKGGGGWRRLSRGPSDAISRESLGEQSYVLVRPFKGMRPDPAYMDSSRK